VRTLGGRAVIFGQQGSLGALGLEHDFVFLLQLFAEEWQSRTCFGLSGICDEARL
jgi:hypothetical protein